MPFFSTPMEKDFVYFNQSVIMIDDSPTSSLCIGIDNPTVNLGEKFFLIPNDLLIQDIFFQKPVPHILLGI
jgi:hypothetical protein